MAKTVAISEDAHLRIIEKQTELLKKYRVNVRIYDIMNALIETHINDEDVESVLIERFEQKNGVHDEQYNRQSL